MTLQASGSMTIADINTELGNSPTAPLSTSDANFLHLAGTSTPTIPDDFYGKLFKRDYSVTTVDFGTVIQFIGEGVSGSIDSTSYGSYTIYAVFGYTDDANFLTEPFRVDLDGTQPSDAIHAFRYNGVDYPRSRTTNQSGRTQYYFGTATNPATGVWSAAGTYDISLIL